MDNASATSFLDLEAKIQRTLSLINGAKEELKKYREMLDDAFEHDVVYHEQAEKADEVRKIKMNTKQQILKDPAVAELDEKVKSVRAQIKELQESLSKDLQQYQETTGSKQIETEDGEILDIVNQVKLVKRAISRR